MVAIQLIILAGEMWYNFLTEYFFDAEIASFAHLKYVKISDTEAKVVGHKSGLESKLTVPINVMIGLHIYKVTRIGNYAFYGCSSLTSIKIPEGVTSIGDNAFTGCKSLTRIKIPENVTSIGKEAFYGCRNLNVLIDNSKEKVEIGEDAFKGCKSVKFLK